MAVEGALYLFMTYRIDLTNFLALEPKPNPANDPTKQGSLRMDEDENVKKESEAVLDMEIFEIERQPQSNMGLTGDTIYQAAVNPTLGEAVRAAVYLDDSNGLIDPYSLRVAGLRKLYPPKKPGDKVLAAVNNLSLRIPRGEVFGLLGANGAGKTTAISMIMRATYPNFGDIHIEGYSVLKDFKSAAQHLGVVTQHNTLWDRLSCKDHLKLFAQIRGVPPHQVNEMVRRTIIELELGPYQDKLAMQLSGGMKRKLCVAVALIGDPKLVLLDEPSAGLDPVSRRNLWDTLIKTMASRAVVLTTHSMEEAEALCTRIGIMVKGKLRALGSPQQLKIQLGVGYEIALKMHSSIQKDATSSTSELSILRALKTRFPSISMISNNGGLSTYSITANEMNVGIAFSLLENIRKEEQGRFDYAISQPTLEQVFVSTVMEHSGGERSNQSRTITTNNHFTTPNQDDVEDDVEDGSGGGGYNLMNRSNTSDDNASHMTEVTPISSHHSSSQSSSSIQKHQNNQNQNNNNNNETNHRDSLIIEEDFDTGIPDSWCGLNKRSHRFMAIASGILAWLGYQTIFRGRIGYVFLPFLLAFIASVIGCAGCCCLIPNDPDDSSEKD